MPSARDFSLAGLEQQVLQGGLVNGINACIAELPKTPSGKVQRFLLRQRG
ncbi:MAG: hypothetical protein ACLQIQ_03075 [Beijerinckiaceae bacterium]